jgi:crotonobetainyl-CoA:carnitine CoA-transferase CaiB-like acyl-CoA transferase
MGTPRALEGIRVLDLTTPLGEAAGRVFADLGAEVLKLEPPGGCAARFTAPFVDGQDGHPEGSLFWRAFGLGKKSLVLDLDAAADREHFLGLVRGADVLLESSTPGALDALGLGYEGVARENPALLYVSITPYGQHGPLAKAPATDLTIAAAGSLPNMQGDRDRPPIPIGQSEASCHGAVQAAAEAILALLERERTGLGQHLDASMQAAMVWTLLFVTGHATLYGEDVPGYGAQRGDPQPELLPGVVIPNVARTKDGFVVMTLVLGEVGARGFGKLMAFAAERGGLEPDIAARDWGGWMQQLGAGELAPADLARALQQLVRFLGTCTKAEIQERAVREAWLAGPAWTAAELLADRQLEAREYWTRVGDTIHPGAFAKLSRTPIQLAAPAPRLGSDQPLATGSPRTPSLGQTAGQERQGSLLAGLKVADFSWVGAGPLVSKDLANLGATVVHVESDKFVDPLRMVPPWKDRMPNPATGHTAANFNQSKLGLALDLKTEKGREVALRLVDWADVVIESFTPGTAAKLGLAWEALSKRKPGLVMLSSCLRGQTGPERAYTGFGLQGAGLAGFCAVTGWPDRLPTGPWAAYTDFIAPRYSIAALGAALFHHARTGEGQYIDLAQVEAAIHFLEPMVLDYTVNGRIAGLAGMNSERACPHGIFPAAEEQRYVAISVETDAQWRALRGLVPGLAEFDAAEWASLRSRIAAKERLEAPLSAWCAEQPAFRCADQLREAGVPAYVALRATDLHDDPQLEARGFFVERDHPRVGQALYDGPVTQFSATPPEVRCAGPAVGHDTFDVMTRILGYDEETVAELAAAEVLS